MVFLCFGLLLGDPAPPGAPHRAALSGNGQPANAPLLRNTSPSGNGQIQGSGGQATITGLAGNNPFTSLTFGLENNATFTAAVLNPDVTNSAGNGTIDFTVNYLLGDGLGPYAESFSVNANGQNFFRIDALPDARITSINYNSTNTTFADTSQFRLGGFAPGTRVPDGGATVALMGLALGGLNLGRRFLKVKTA